MTKQLRRSLLFTPGDSQRKISKAAQLNADSIILDLEDSIAPEQKVAVRQMVAEALLTADFGGSECLVRVNGPTTAYHADDLEVISASRPDGIVVPKVETAVHIHQIDQKLTAIEQANGWTNGIIRLMPIIETALGVMNLKEICQASPRTEALMFGAEDLAADMGSIRTTASWEIFYARSAVVTAAAAYRLQAIDVVFFNFEDDQGLIEECQFARQMGYCGKMAIHPRQVAIINRAFSPTASEIEEARKIVEAYEAHLAAGKGVFAINGRMVDMPVVKAARRILAAVNVGHARSVTNQ